MSYLISIGLEVHAQLLTQSKLFCSCSTEFGKPPNSQTCPVCLGMPGILPVVNKKAVEFALRIALATHCTIAAHSIFARKNYFYPDLPKGYQISQYELPLAKGGYIDVDLDGQIRRIDIARIHMEEDAGKSIHAQEEASCSGTLVDMNRCGIPLVEIVSEPQIRSPQEANRYLQKIRQLVQYLEVCDGNMEQGSLRCDANISVRPEEQEALGTKTELKNMNSFRGVQRAVEYEIQRQIALLERGKRVYHETLLWDEKKQVAVSMRSKEQVHDYRYFPEPDLVPLKIDPSWVEKVRKTQPELPHQRKARLVREHNIPEYDAEILTSTRTLADYYEACVRRFPQPKTVSNWVMGEVLRELKERKLEVEQFPMTASDLAGLLDLIRDGTISGKLAKEVFARMVETGKGAKEIVQELGWFQIVDQEAIGEAIDGVLSDNPDQVRAYREGEVKLWGYFMGQVMKATEGKANPKVVDSLLRKRLGRN